MTIFLYWRNIWKQSNSSFLIIYFRLWVSAVLMLLRMLTLQKRAKKWNMLSILRYTLCYVLYVLWHVSKMWCLYGSLPSGVYTCRGDRCSSHGGTFVAPRCQDHFDAWELLFIVQMLSSATWKDRWKPWKPCISTWKENKHGRKHRKSNRNERKPRKN